MTSERGAPDRVGVARQLQPNQLQVCFQCLMTQAMPRPIQDRIAQQMRSEYHLTADKPALLGDPAIPVTFEEPLRRLKERERARVHELAVAAVATALLSTEP